VAAEVGSVEPGAAGALLHDAGDHAIRKPRGAELAAFGNRAEHRALRDARAIEPGAQRFDRAACVAPHIVEAALNHISGARAGVAGVYNRAAYAAEKKVALERWADHIAGLVAGRKAKVVPLRGSSS
jgi:hypothetical protein